MNTMVLLRVVHVLSIILWIGGVAMVTTVLLPALRRMDHDGNPIDLFERIEGAFGLQAKITTTLAGASGFLLLHLLHGWGRYLEPRFWWLHLMTLVWLLFTVVLFVLEPLVLHRWFHEQGALHPAETLARAHRLHVVLLALSLVAAAGAIAGSHGWFLF